MKTWTFGSDTPIAGLAMHNGGKPAAAFMAPLQQPFRDVANLLGVAWWARIDTRQPDVTYWFGPYVRRSSLEASLPSILADLREEGPAVLEHRLLRTRRREPLTIEHSTPAS
jgi:hypothetical protein